MTNTTQTFYISPAFSNLILNNIFGIPDLTYSSSEIYVGLGITLDTTNFVFTEEPVSVGYTILPTPIEFSTPINGMIRNKYTINWPKATIDWTTGTQKIKYIGLYYKTTVEGVDTYTLMVVLHLTPEETVLINETFVLNANSIQISLNNK